MDKGFEIKRITLNERPEATYNYCLEVITKAEPNVQTEYTLHGMRDAEHAAQVFEEMPEVPAEQDCIRYYLMNDF